MRQPIKRSRSRCSVRPVIARRTPFSAFARVTLGPVQYGGHQVVVRDTRLSDFERWRDIRLRDQQYLEPFWVTSQLSWQDRHTEAWWIREWLRQRQARLRGHSLPMTVEIDGEFAGQCNFDPITWANRSAEMGIWLDSRLARSGVGLIIGALVVDYGLGVLGLNRITAPACVDNKRASIAASRGGMSLEATMRAAYDVGGALRDHELWAATTSNRPDGGFVAAMYRAHPNTAPAAPHVASAVGSVPLRHVVSAAARYYAGAPRRLLVDRPRNALPTQLGPQDLDGAPLVLRRRTGTSRFVLQVGSRDLGFCTVHPGYGGLELSPQWPDAEPGIAAAAITMIADQLAAPRVSVLVAPGDSRQTEALTRAGLVMEGTLVGAQPIGNAGFADRDLWAKTASPTDPSGDDRS